MTEVEFNFEGEASARLISQIELEESIRKTVLLYNRLNSPKVLTKIVMLLPEQVTISFSGSFCYECGGYLSFIEEFAREFKIFNKLFELSAGQIRQTGARSFEVDYKVKALQNRI